MSEETPPVEPDDSVVDADDNVPVLEEGMETIDLADSIEIEVVDPLEEANLRAEKAEKEIAYKDAEIQNVRKRLMAEKAELIQYSGMGLARRMLTVLGDVDRAIANLDDEDTSAVAQGLRLLRNKMWHELAADGVVAIEAKEQSFDPAKMEAITTIPASDAFPAGKVVDVLEAGYMYKQRVLMAARVVVASDE
ncbi:MAG: nucleotide exchange factor GrpE [Euryarchaeota archaeon]|jgi:molecular chaperone GrpE|nr:nucleotide exchange factor GrpE [Euryarchaeota archaeon]MBT5025157.1 nucleotide exchange factor GrpE [Euryarchaeota archaeon]MBT6255620.1 nucleotide exchange factor GrpE [Euryarchaeota archaeon]MBT6527176.1 nucleotide exchange factor GrpE [Euryarchaeota archaeon]MBT7961483.1 nucleotide exchange factor GrpE [Euryarchaeota archaeon]